VPDKLTELKRCTVLKETEKAWLIEYDNEEHWFPKSLCEWHEDGDTLVLPVWLVKDKGIEINR
jgi:hypothetical protein